MFNYLQHSVILGQVWGFQVLVLLHGGLPVAAAVLLMMLLLDLLVKVVDLVDLMLVLVRGVL